MKWRRIIGVLAISLGVAQRRGYPSSNANRGQSGFALAAMDRATIIHRANDLEERVWLEEYHIATQKRIIDQLERDGNDAQIAKGRLVRFEALLAVLVAERERLKMELAGLGPDDAE